MDLNGNEGLEPGLGLVRFTRSMSGKRIAISSHDEMESTPLLKKRCSRKLDQDFESSQLESLPYDILMKVLCGVDHEDLKRLFHVSTTIREATLIARKTHFEYSTPRKIAVFRDLDLDSEGFDAPNAPKRPRYRRSIMDKKKLADISVALFA